MSFQVVKLRRYPVKSMGGEALRTAEFDTRGMTGDRWYAVRDDAGHFASGKDTRRFRRRDRVFDYKATTGDHAVTVTGPTGSWTVGDPTLDEHLSTAMGAPVAVTAESGIAHQDDGAVSLIGTATLSWCAERFGIDADPRRLRVNIVFESAEPFVEETWLGRPVELGTAVLRVVGTVERCRMIDIAQDGVIPSGRWLKRLAAERNMNAAVYADVVQPGRTSIGDVLNPT
jgi:uncharacterized protein